MDDLIHIGPPKLGLWQLEPLDGIRAETNPPTSNQGGKPASAGRGGKRAASGGSVDLPSEREGAGNGWTWYERSVQETGREVGKRRSPPYPIGTMPARWEAIGQIYEHVAGKDLPPCNITSEAI